MQLMNGMILLLVREVFGIPLDFALAGILVGAMLGLIVWGSRPSVIARYRKTPPEEEAEQPKPEEDAR
jgi:hypothetical protein